MSYKFTCLKFSRAKDVYAGDRAVYPPKPETPSVPKPSNGKIETHRFPPSMYLVDSVFTPLSLYCKQYFANDFFCSKADLTIASSFDHKRALVVIRDAHVGLAYTHAN